MELTDTLFTCLISLYYHLFDVKVFTVTFAMRALVVSPGGGVLPCMGYIGMSGPKGYGFSAVLVINRVSI